MAKLYTSSRNLLIQVSFTETRTLLWSLREAKSEYLVCPIVFKIYIKSIEGHNLKTMQLQLIYLGAAYSMSNLFCSTLKTRVCYF